MKIFARTILTLIFLLNFVCLIFGQDKPTRQQQILQEIERQRKIEDAKDREIKEQLGLNKEKKPVGKFFYEKGVGLTTKAIAQKRNVNQYVWGGHFDCREWAKKDELSLECDKKKVSEFIWQNWENKKRSYFTISGDSVDATSTIHIFIEPDKNGKWIIVERIARFQAINIKFPYSIDDFPNIISVAIVEKKNNTSEYSLIFKDKSGETSHPISYFLD